MSSVVSALRAATHVLNAWIWQDWVLYTVLATGVLFTLWSGFSQLRCLTDGVRLLRRSSDDPEAPGALTHFQALSAALSATVGLGNIGGVAVGISLGGPGAVFWMWVIGFVGMALKTTEVTLSMLYRVADEDGEPHGGPMWVVSRAVSERWPRFSRLGWMAGAFFCVALLTSAITGGNMFQAWNVAALTEDALGVDGPWTGLVLALLVAAVILGGIGRIGRVASRLVPFMCLLYLAAVFVVLALRIEEVPAMLRLIVSGAFSSQEAQGAFLGGTAGSAFSWGMKRALFSSEVGQGSSPIAHAAARTSEPVSEGLVAGLEPFVDTLVVCTLTAFAILASGAWDRPVEARFTRVPEVVALAAPDSWTLGGVMPDTAQGFAGTTDLPPKSDRLALDASGPWRAGQDVFAILRAGGEPVRVSGRVRESPEGLLVDWQEISSPEEPSFARGQEGVHREYVAAQLTAHAFNLTLPGLGTWLLLVASWLFALSTQISWSYYAEQAVVFLVGRRWVPAFRCLYCVLVFVACLGLVRTEADLDSIASLGTGLSLWANLPITLLFGATAVSAYRDYVHRNPGGFLVSDRDPGCRW